MMEFIKRRQRWFRERMWNARCQRVEVAWDLCREQRARDLHRRQSVLQWREECEKRQRAIDAHDEAIPLGKGKWISPRAAHEWELVDLLRKMSGIWPVRHRDHLQRDLIAALAGKAGPHGCSPDSFDNAVKLIEEKDKDD